MAQLSFSERNEKEFGFMYSVEPINTYHAIKGRFVGTCVWSAKEFVKYYKDIVQQDDEAKIVRLLDELCLVMKFIEKSKSTYDVTQDRDDDQEIPWFIPELEISTEAVHAIENQWKLSLIEKAELVFSTRFYKIDEVLIVVSLIYLHLHHQI